MANTLCRKSAGNRFWDGYWECKRSVPVWERSVYDDEEFAAALAEYRSLSIQDALVSVNPIVRMFSVLDRRVGRRTLEKLAAEIQDQPDWLKAFFRLRMDAENIHIPKKKLYIDASSRAGAWCVIGRDAEIIQAGTTVYSMPVSDRNAEYDRWAAEYDIHFIFDDCAVEPDFYAVPRFDVFATDSRGGYIGTIGATSDLQGDAPVGYVDWEKKVFQIAPNGPEFMRRAPQWRKYLAPCNGIKLYKSKVEAQTALEFINLSDFR